MMHVATLKALLSGITIHLLQKAQIAVLKQNHASTQVLTKYSDFAKIFLADKTLVLPEQIELNKHAIELEGDKQPPYRLIYSLGPVELEIFLFNKKPNNSFYLYINY